MSEDDKEQQNDPSGGFKGLMEEYRKSAEKRQQSLNRTLGDNLGRRTISDQAPKKKKKKKKRTRQQQQD